MLFLIKCFITKVETSQFLVQNPDTPVLSKHYWSCRGWWKEGSLWVLSSWNWTVLQCQRESIHHTYAKDLHGTLHVMTSRWEAVINVKKIIESVNEDALKHEQDFTKHDMHFYFVPPSYCYHIFGNCGKINFN